MQLPEGCHGRIAPRSGLTLEYHIDIAGGVVGEDYHCNIDVILYNHSDKPYNVSSDDRIAQLRSIILH